MKKRGLVSTFIIIGLILLFSVALVIFLQKQFVVFSPKILIPPELRKVDDYVETCLERSLASGVGQLKLKGGYIELPHILTRIL